jgi:single-strand DNA-binding protein
MAAGFNRVTLIGNLTRDPHSKALPSGVTLCEFGLAINRRYKSAGEDRDEVCFVDCTAYGKQGDVIQEFCRKGRSLFVEGRLKYDTWDDKSGSKRSKLTVVVENFQFLGGRDDAGTGEHPGVAAEGGLTVDRSTDQTRGESNGQRRQWKPTQNRLFAAEGQNRRGRKENVESPVSSDEQFTEADIPF